MLVYFKVKDKRDKSKIFQTIYLPNDLSIKDRSIKFEKLEKYFNEKSNYNVNEYTLEDVLEDKVKSYTFQRQQYNDWVTTEEHFQNFENSEYILTYSEPEIFMLSDLVGWNFINIFKYTEYTEYGDRRFTFEKDGKYKQYTISSEKGEGLRRDYCFEKDGETYDVSNGTVWRKEFHGDMYQFSQELKGEVKSISYDTEKIEIKTDKGKFSYNTKYRDKLLINEVNYIECPYDKVKKEYYITRTTREHAQWKAWNKTKFYCFSIDESNESKWLKDNKVSVYLKIYNKQDNNCVLELFSLEEDYLHNIQNLENKYYEIVKQVIDKCNSTGDFSCFDKMSTFETFETFIETTNNFN